MKQADPDELTVEQLQEWGTEELQEESKRRFDLYVDTFHKKVRKEAMWGLTLIVLKGRLGYGKWEDWFQKTFLMNPSTAWRYMKLGEGWPKVREWVEANPKVSKTQVLKRIKQLEGKADKAGPALPPASVNGDTEAEFAREYVCLEFAKRVREQWPAGDVVFLSSSFHDTDVLGELLDFIKVQIHPLAKVVVPAWQRLEEAKAALDRQQLDAEGHTVAEQALDEAFRKEVWSAFAERKFASRFQKSVILQLTKGMSIPKAERRRFWELPAERPREFEP
jgi:hypothetical protein